MTRVWYREVLQRVNEGDNILDVGIGTGTALLDNFALLQKRKLSVFGVDYDQNYIDLGRKQIADKLKLHLHDPKTLNTSCGAVRLTCRSIFDVKGIVKDHLSIYITQTFQKKHSPIAAFLKPLLRYVMQGPGGGKSKIPRIPLALAGPVIYVTTIDFGVLTYERDLDEILQRAKTCGLEVVSNEPIPNSINTQWQVAKIICLRCVDESAEQL
eukprot:g5416.t1